MCELDIVREMLSYLDHEPSVPMLIGYAKREKADWLNVLVSNPQIVLLLKAYNEDNDFIHKLELQKA